MLLKKPILITHTKKKRNMEVSFLSFPFFYKKVMRTKKKSNPTCLTQCHPEMTPSTPLRSFQSSPSLTVVIRNLLPISPHILTTLKDRHFEPSRCPIFRRLFANERRHDGALPQKWVLRRCHHHAIADAADEAEFPLTMIMALT